ncbi:hypothetical protein [uncultured Pseudodesulfovibrio sp.]|uniref:efflux RND transporter periplasmic adaptor subunit n=1 Tax=uncultured Pseudodesulfovibrio sp. TaxID=2035858 RepID=UPI0029C92593|nr:hypothetical protein [uncultured Pseudodesulfovibrio sp.]
MIARLKGKYPYWKRFLVVPVVGMGILFFLGMVKTRQQPMKNALKERVTLVRVIEAEAMPVVPRAIGYGYIQPGQVWDAVAEVPGKIVEVHPEFERGSVLAKGEILMRIDPAASGYVREQSEAEVERVQAELRKLDQSERDTRRQLEVEQGRLELAAKDLDRNKRLVSQGVISQSELDAQEQSYLSQRNAVQNYQSTLNGIPASRASLMAQLASARSKTAGARLDEDNTIIRTPFNCRISATNVELGQAVGMNQVVATLDSLGENEALVQVPLHAFKNLLPQGQVAIPGAQPQMEEFRQFLGIDAIIRVRAQEQTMEWIGHVTRISDAVDVDTRTIGVFVSVDNRIKTAQKEYYTPLIKNMYAEVELLGRPTEPFVVVPRMAVEAGYVNVVGKDNRLERRRVTVAFIQSSIAVLRSGVLGGERVIVSELIPSIEGMKLSPSLDDELQRRMENEALAKVAVK